MKTGVLVYIAGPYTNPDPVQNTRNAIDIGMKVWHDKIGYPVIPHLSLFLHLVDPRPLDFWYEFDLAVLERCDVLLRLPGASTGADKEVEFAREHGIPVFEHYLDLLHWAAG